jgi:hypothetical protein
MKAKSTSLAAGLLVVVAGLMGGCVIAPHDGYHEGYYDRDHHRYYHENAWHGCAEHDEHCR